MKRYIPDITICGCADVIGLVEENQKLGRPFDMVISLEPEVSRTNQKAPHLEKELGDPYWTDRQIIIQFADAEWRSLPTAPKSEQIKAALDHFDKYGPKDRPARVLVHCHEGRCRSSALAVGLFLHVMGSGHEQECLEKVMKLRPEARPNLLVIEHVDTLCGCGGALVKVVRKAFRITTLQGLEAKVRHRITDAWETAKWMGRGCRDPVLRRINRPRSPSSLHS